jgi:hypothetical protein
MRKPESSDPKELRGELLEYLYQDEACQPERAKVLYQLAEHRKRFPNIKDISTFKENA